MEVKLMNIVRDNFEDVIELELEKAQEKNLPSNVYSIAESTLSTIIQPRPICLGEKVVRFVMYQFG